MKKAKKAMLTWEIEWIYWGGIPRVFKYKTRKEARNILKDLKHVPRVSIVGFYRVATVVAPSGNQLQIRKKTS